MLGGKKSRKIKSLFMILILISTGFLICIQSNQFSTSADASSIWKQDSYNDFVNGNTSKVNINGTGLNANLRLKYNATIDWNDLGLSIHPSKRRGHKITQIWGTDKILLFGGRNDTDYQWNDTWIYDLSDNNWTRIFPPVSPSTRDSFGLEPIWGTDKVLLFGGQHKNETGVWHYLNDTWIFNLNNYTWIKRDPGDPPTKRVAPSMSFIHGEDKVILFGGMTSIGVGIHNQDTWLYDLSNDEWEEQNIIIKPPKRVEHEMAPFYNDDKILMFGGNDAGNILDDTWVYDLSEQNWEMKNPIIKPDNRYRHAMAMVNAKNKVVLYGGTDNSFALNDTWVYDLGNNTWDQKDTVSQSPKRQWPGMAAIYGTNKILLFGGNRGVYGDFNDTWLLNVTLSYDEEGSFISSILETVTNATFRSINWNVNIPTLTDIKFQLRSAITKSALDSTNFVGPGGYIDAFYTTSGEDIWSGHNSHRWMQYKVYLSTNNRLITPALNNVTITYNLWPNTILIGPNDNDIISDNTPTFSWEFNDSDSSQQSQFQVLISNESSFKNISFDSGEVSSTETQWTFATGTSLTVLPDGTWFWKARVKDNDGDWSELTEPFKLTIDANPPSSIIDYPINNGFYSFLNKINGTAFEHSKGIGINRIEILLKRLSDNYYWSGAAWMPNEVWLGTTGTTDWSYSTSTVDWTSGIKYSVQARAIDELFNIESPSNLTVFTIDSDKPRSYIEHPLKDTYLNTLDLISGSAEDVNGSGVSKVEICIRNNDNDDYWSGTDWVDELTWLETNGKDHWKYNTSDLPWITDTWYNIRSRAQDNMTLSNEIHIETPGKGTNFMYDNRSPVDLSIMIDNGAATTYNNSVTLTLTAIDTGSGVYQMAFSNDGTTWESWENFTKIRTYDLNIGTGEKTIHFKVRDRAGNIADSILGTIIATSVEILVDTDGDNFPDEWEILLGSDPEDDTNKPFDTDKDGMPDGDDENSEPWMDTDDDNDSVPDELDAFPTDIAASIDTDGDNYPDDWNTGKSEKDSTTGLKKDEYPNDPDKWKKKTVEEYSMIWIVILFIVIILLLMIAKVTAVVRKNRRVRDEYPYTKDQTLRNLRNEVLNGKKSNIVKLSHDELKNILKEKEQEGKITQNDYDYIDKVFLCSELEENEQYQLKDDNENETKGEK